MKDKTEIEFDEAWLRTQLPAIRESQVKAFKTILRTALMRAKGLTAKDTKEAWNLALGETNFRAAANSLTSRLSNEAELRSALVRLEYIAKQGQFAGKEQL